MTGKVGDILLAENAKPHIVHDGGDHALGCLPAKQAALTDAS